MQAEFNLKREQNNRLICEIGRHPRCNLHFHSQIEIYLVVSGEVEVWVNNSRRVLTAGEMSVALSYDAHGYHEVREAEIEYLIVPTDLCGEFLKVLQNKQIENPFISDRALFDEIKTCFLRIRESGNEISVRGYIYVILGMLLDRIRFEARREPKDHEVSSEILRYISAHCREDLSASSISLAFGYNPSYLSRAFKSKFKIGLTQYITMMRLREAVLLMKDPGKSITECAYESGFRSLRTFYRCFQNEFGCAPQEYRIKNTSARREG